MDELLKRFELVLKVGGSENFLLEDYQNLVEYYKDNNLPVHALLVCNHALEKHLYSFDFYCEGISLAIDLEDYHEAQKMLDKALNVFPNDLDLQLLQATNFIADNKPNKAKEILDFLIKENPKSSAIHFMLGSVLYRFYEAYNIAEKHFLECIEIDAKSPHVYGELVDLYYETNDILAGILFFDSLSEKYPTNSDIWYNLGKLYKYNEQDKDAKNALENAYCLDEKNNMISLQLGYISMNMGDYLEAISHFEKVGEGDSETTKRDAFYEMGQCYDHLGSKLALTYYKKSLKIDALHLVSLFALGSYYYKNKNWFLASKLFEKCTNLDDESAKYWFSYAQAQKALGNLISSVEMFDKAATIDEEDSKIWFEWGLLYIENAQYEDGIIVLRNGIDACPLDSKLYYLLSFCLIKKGLYQDGFLQLQIGLSLNFENHTIMLNFIDSEELKSTLYKIFEKYKNEQ